MKARKKWTLQARVAGCGALYQWTLSFALLERGVGFRSKVALRKKPMRDPPLRFAPVALLAELRTKWAAIELYQTQKFIGPLMTTAMGGLSARNGNIRRAPLVGAEAGWSIQDGSGADEQRPPRKAAKRDSREARTACCGSKVQ